jgi:hypothetical protein
MTESLLISKAVELDARLSGELKDSGVAINVGMQLVNERLNSPALDLPKNAFPED